MVEPVSMNAANNWVTGVSKISAYVFYVVVLSLILQVRIKFGRDEWRTHRRLLWVPRTRLSQRWFDK